MGDKHYTETHAPVHVALVADELNQPTYDDCTLVVSTCRSITARLTTDHHAQRGSRLAKDVVTGPCFRVNAHVIHCQGVY